MDFTKFTSFEWAVFSIEVVVFLWAANMLYKKIVEPFREQAERAKDLLAVKEVCDGCGNEFGYHLHNHFVYRSCSIECDEFLNEVFSEMAE